MALARSVVLDILIPDNILALSAVVDQTQTVLLTRSQIDLVISDRHDAQPFYMPEQHPLPHISGPSHP